MGKSLEEWEQDGAMRYHHGSKIPYPTRDRHTVEEEAAFLNGFRKESLKHRLESGAPDGYDFD